MPAAEAARVLAARLGSRRGRPAVTSTRPRAAGSRSRTRAWCSRSSCPRAGRAVRARARAGGTTVSAVVRAPLTEFLAVPTGTVPAGERPGGRDGDVFCRHAATELSVAYAILVPQRRARIAALAAEGRTP